jgi:orotidine-5'-phosphate decarboxylase
MTGTGPGTGIPAEHRLIYALDRMTLAEAIASVRRLCGVIKIFKVGPALIYEGGLQAARQIAQAGGDQGVRIFLDMKTWDIPETVRNTLDAIEQFGAGTVLFATLHAQALTRNAAVQPQAKRSFKLLAVTHLTSLGQADLAAMGIALSVGDYVLRMAERARESGCDGVICSGEEVGRIKARLGAAFLAVTPGIRPGGASVSQEDQQRIVTPRQAILNGADYLVVGRPIREASDPLGAAQAIQAEIADALRERG